MEFGTEDGMSPATVRADEIVFGAAVRSDCYAYFSYSSYSPLIVLIHKWTSIRRGYED